MSVMLNHPCNTHLFNQFSAAYDNGRMFGTIRNAIISFNFHGVRTIFQAFRDDKFKFPSALLPQVIYAGYPTSGGVGT